MCKVTNDQSQNIVFLEPSASLACHIIQYLFTSSPKPLVYRRSTTDQRMITASFRCIVFNTFLLVLKCLFLLSNSLSKLQKTSIYYILPYLIKKNNVDIS